MFSAYFYSLIFFGAINGRPTAVPNAKRFRSPDDLGRPKSQQRCSLPAAATTVASATAAISSTEIAITTGGSAEVTAPTKATHRSATEAGVIARSDSHGRALRRRKAP
jgi:hypothetical protein